MSQLVGVPHDRVKDVWGLIEHLLVPVSEGSLDNYTVEEYRTDCENRDAQLWLSVKDGEIESCAVTRIDVYRRFKSCAFIAVGGRERDNWLEFESDIAEWAKAQGCTYLDGFFRKGWERVLRDQGWSLGWTFARKRL